jgi:hypothetical protein
MNDDELFDDAADQAVDLGNQIADDHPDGDLWAIADGLIAGAVHFWLYAHQPESIAHEDDLEGHRTASERLETLTRLLHEAAVDSEYLHSPHDADAGRA